jgi:hypothetical protein
LKMILMANTFASYWRRIYHRSYCRRDLIKILTTKKKDGTARLFVAIKRGCGTASRRSVESCRSPKTKWGNTKNSKSNTENSRSKWAHVMRCFCSLFAAGYGKIHADISELPNTTTKPALHWVSSLNINARRIRSAKPNTQMTSYSRYASNSFLL